MVSRPTDISWLAGRQELHKDQAMQFKVSLNDIRPEIWRRIQVPASYSFWDLHVAIQDAMGWKDCHLHQFTVRTRGAESPPIFGIPVDKFVGRRGVLPGWEHLIAIYFSPESAEADYWYDFGDDWNHVVLLEEVLPKVLGQKYPVCTGGARACPPEDCGGPPGYAKLVMAMKRPASKAAADFIKWLGKPYDAEAFDASRVKFHSPKARLRRLRGR